MNFRRLNGTAISFHDVSQGFKRGLHDGSFDIFAGKLKPNCSRVNHALVVSASQLFEHVAEDAFVGVVIRPNDARRAIRGADGRH